ncbi:hypothetical protein Plhal304r1_c013g0049851 [Plasmopara halstedii]
MVFQTIAWLLLEPKTTLYSPRFSQVSASVYYEMFSFWVQPQVVLVLGHIKYLVLDSMPEDAAKRTGDLKETKKLLRLTVRSFDDVRLTQLYQTATKTQIVEVFVDMEHTRQRLLSALRGGISVINKRTLLDDAFATLEEAQQSTDEDEAIKLYMEAERGFEKAELLTDDRSRELLKARRADLQQTIIKKFVKNKNVVNEKLNACNAVAPSVTTQTNVESFKLITARLDELRRFSAQQKAQVPPIDLTARLALLNNREIGPAPREDDLVERLRRLKGDNASSESGSSFQNVTFPGISAIDNIIEQVEDELMLGITDETSEFEHLY